MELRVIKIGNSVGVILPPELLAHLNVTVGDSLSVSWEPAGIKLMSSGTTFQLATARTVMLRRKRALGELAK